MLTITVPKTDNFDEKSDKFIIREEVTLLLEHSLVSLSKWESLMEKPFLSDVPKTNAETFEYIKAMTLTPDVDPEVYTRLTSENLDSVSAYIDAKMTATWFTEATVKPTKPTTLSKKETITAETIYYWMVSLTIPFECQTWHLNRLLTLIKMCNHKNSPPKKMTKTELFEYNRTLNEQRKAALKTAG